jgi:lipoate-protein ligase A
MFKQIRVLETGRNSGAWNMALDEALLTNLVDHDTPILRLYGWQPPCVSIGYFQSMEEEVDVIKCSSMGVDVVRRITGGGAVLHEFELTYTLITKKYPANILESYELICEPVVLCLNRLGYNAKYVPLNDIVVDNKKVSGNAQTRKNNTLLQHGTILLAVDIERMFSMLKVPSEKIKDKMIKDVKARVTGINRSFEEVAINLKESFAEIFGAQIIKDTLSSKEKEDIEKLVIEKYSSRQWNWRK